MLTESAEKYVANKGVLRKGRISDGWWRRFLSRQEGELVFRKGDSTSFLRMDAMNEDTIKHYSITLIYWKIH